MLDDSLDSRAARLNDRYRHHAATEVLRRAVSDPDLGRVALVSSFGAESAVLLHMVAQIDRAARRVQEGAAEMARVEAALDRAAILPRLCRNRRLAWQAVSDNFRIGVAVFTPRLDGATEVTLDAELLDRIDEIVPPGEHLTRALRLLEKENGPDSAALTERTLR